MKKSELKSIIKECIKEVIFEEGTLSTIISEVVQGTSRIKPITEATQLSTKQDEKKLEEIKKNRKKMLDAIGRDAYNGVDLFENTTPMKSGGNTNHGALSGMDPRDPGVDISNIFSPTSSAIWKKLSGK